MKILNKDSVPVNEKKKDKKRELIRKDDITIHERSIISSIVYHYTYKYDLMTYSVVVMIGT